MFRSIIIITNDKYKEENSKRVFVLGNPQDGRINKNEKYIGKLNTKYK